MSDPSSTSRQARESLSRGLNALQADPSVPPHLVELAAPIAQAMGALHQIERTNQLAPHADVALGHVRGALAQLQAQPGSHPAVESALQAVAGSLTLVHSLSKMANGPAPAPPAQAAPPVQPAAQPAPVQPAPQPAPVQHAAPQPAPVQHAQPVPAPVQHAQPVPAPQPAPAQPGGGVKTGTANLGPHAPRTGQAPQHQPSFPQGAPAHQAPPQHQAPLQQHQPPPQHQAPPQQYAPPQGYGGAPMAARDPFASPDPFAAPPAHGHAPPAHGHPPQGAYGQPPIGPSASPSMPVPAPPAAGNVQTISADLGAHSATNFYKGLSGNDIIDHGGLFVSTYMTPKPGTPIRLRVSLPGGYEFEANAVVKWTREQSGDAQPGFGAQFTAITPEARQLVYRYVRNREPLFHDDF